MKRCLSLLALGLVIMTGAASAWYPTSVQVEFATATW